MQATQVIQLHAPMVFAVVAYAVGMGIDVSKDKLDLAIRLSDGKYIEASFVNDIKGIRSLCIFLKKQEAASTAPLVIESTGDYHLQSALILSQRGYLVNEINPIITKQYQNSSIRNAKTDKIDARRLADIAFLEPNLLPYKSTLDQVMARKLTSLLAHLEKDKQGMSASLKKFTETAKKLGIKHSTIHIRKAVAEIDAQIACTQAMLVDLVPESVLELADRTKGISRVNLAIIYVLANGKQFDNCDKLNAFFGIDIAIRKSGKWTGHARLSKRGNSYARKILYQMAWGMKMNNEIFKKCYSERRASGKYHYNTIMAILSRKCLRYLFSNLFQGTANA